MKGGSLADDEEREANERDATARRLSGVSVTYLVTDI